MAHMKHDDLTLVIVDRIDHAMVAYSDTPAFTILKLAAPAWPRFFWQRADGGQHTYSDLSWQPMKFSLSPPQECDPIRRHG